MIAAAENQAEVIGVLVKHGAEVNGRSAALSYPKDRFGLEGVLTILPHGSWTPLMYAARDGALDAARALIEAGAELNSRRSRRDHASAARDHERALRYSRAAGGKGRQSECGG